MEGRRGGSGCGRRKGTRGRERSIGGGGGERGGVGEGHRSGGSGGGVKVGMTGDGNLRTRMRERVCAGGGEGQRIGRGRFEWNKE